MMPADGLDQLRQHDAIFLGAVGWPGVADHVSLWGLLIPIRRGFDQYANVRPCKLLPGVRSPLAGRTEEDIDFYVVRENNEGEYSSVGGRMFVDTPRRIRFTQQSIFTRVGTDRIFALMRSSWPKKRPRKHVTSATKSNGITFTMPFWDERFAEMAKHYPDVKTAQYHIDIPSARISYGIRTGSTWWWVPICSAIFFRISGLRWSAPSVSRRRPISIRSERFLRCSSRCMVPRPISPGRKSAILSARFGARR